MEGKIIVDDKTLGLMSLSKKFNEAAGDAPLGLRYALIERSVSLGSLGVIADIVGAGISDYVSKQDESTFQVPDEKLAEFAEMYLSYHKDRKAFEDTIKPYSEADGIIESFNAYANLSGDAKIQHASYYGTRTAEITAVVSMGPAVAGVYGSAATTGQTFIGDIYKFLEERGIDVSKEKDLLAGLKDAMAYPEILSNVRANVAYGVAGGAAGAGLGYAASQAGWLNNILAGAGGTLVAQSKSFIGDKTAQIFSGITKNYLKDRVEDVQEAVVESSVDIAMHRDKNPETEISALAFLTPKVLPSM